MQISVADTSVPACFGPEIQTCGAGKGGRERKVFMTGRAIDKPGPGEVYIDVGKKPVV